MKENGGKGGDEGRGKKIEGDFGNKRKKENCDLPVSAKRRDRFVKKYDIRNLDVCRIVALIEHNSVSSRLSGSMKSLKANYKLFDILIS